MNVGDPVQLKNDSSVTMTVAEVATDGSVRAVWFATDKTLQEKWLSVGSFQAPTP